MPKKPEVPPRWGHAQRAQVPSAGSLACWVEGSMQETVASVAWRDLFGVHGPAAEPQGSLRTQCRNQAPPHSASIPHLAPDPPPANPTTNQHHPNDQQPEPADQAHPAARDAPTEKPPTPQPSAALVSAAAEQQGSLRTQCRNQAPPHSASNPHLAPDPPPANPTTNQHHPNDQQPEPADQAHPAARDAPTEKPPTPQLSAALVGARKPMTEPTGQAPAWPGRRCHPFGGPRERWGANLCSRPQTEPQNLFGGATCRGIRCRGRFSATLRRQATECHCGISPRRTRRQTVWWFGCASQIRCADTRSFGGRSRFA